MESQPVTKWRCAALVLVVVVALPGCVRRTIRITSDPPGALVILNDQEIGRTEVSTDFLYYGDYDVIIRREGYKTLKTHWDVKPPWYQVVPIDFFADALWPGHLHDVHTRHFMLEERELPSSEELIKRAEETRARAFERRR